MTTVARFLAVSPDGAAELHEYPLAVAQAVAETMRQGGLRIVWYPLQKPEPVAPPAGPTKRERRRAAREQRRQLAELGIVA